MLRAELRQRLRRVRLQPAVLLLVPERGAHEKKDANLRTGVLPADDSNFRLMRLEPKIYSPANLSGPGATYHLASAACRDRPAAARAPRRAAGAEAHAQAGEKSKTAVDPARAEQ